MQGIRMKIFQGGMIPSAMWPPLEEKKTPSSPGQWVDAWNLLGAAHFFQAPCFCNLIAFPSGSTVSLQNETTSA